MNAYFPEMKKNFGFGCMRLPMKGEKVDFDRTQELFDLFLERGFNYFDVASPYQGGQSQEAVRRCLAQRHPRESFVLTNKLSPNLFEKEEDILPLFQRQLEGSGVEYFDFYLMHAMNARFFEKYQQARAYETCLELKKEGKIRHLGMSFHDSAEVLDRVLTQWPDIEVVQLQFNYADYNDPRVQSRACYDVCRKHGKPVMVMEPVKGGRLVELPQEALKILTNGSPASYAIRFAAGFEGIVMVLSGMSNLQQVRENIAFMEDFKPLSQEEHDQLRRVLPLYQAGHRIPCTGCRYCTDGCPAGIPIPEIFQWVNASRREDTKPEMPYSDFEHPASACIGCGQCQQACPQGLQIPKLLQSITAEFE